MRVAKDVKDAILSRLPGQFVDGRTAFHGPRVPIDDEFVESCAFFVMETGGLPDRVLKGRNTVDATTGLPVVTRVTERNPTVQIIVQSGKVDGAREVGLFMAQAVLDAIDQRPPPGYCDAKVGHGGQPIFAGADDSEGIWLWTINVALKFDLSLKTVYWGIGADSGAGEAFVKALPASDSPRSGAAAVTNRLREFQAEPGAGEHVYYAFPEEYATPGTPVFQIGALPGAFAIEDTPTVDGLPYRLYKSDEAALGAVTVVVS